MTGCKSSGVGGWGLGGKKVEPVVEGVQERSRGELSAAHNFPSPSPHHSSAEARADQSPSA